jgi:hypoxanthine phosphoribosyltransferase
MPEHIYYTNAQMRSDLHAIVRQMNLEGFVPEIVAGLARGGLQPALMLSHYYDAALVALNVSLRDNKVDHGHDSLDTLKADVTAGKRVLIVDDICDSGHTLKAVWDHLDIPLPQPLTFSTGYSGFVRSAVLWNNPAQDVFDPQYYGREINRAEDERWIIFPFEDWWTR